MSSESWRPPTTTPPPRARGLSRLRLEVIEAKIDRGKDDVKCVGKFHCFLVRQQVAVDPVTIPLLSPYQDKQIVSRVLACRLDLDLDLDLYRGVFDLL